MHCSFASNPSKGEGKKRTFKSILILINLFYGKRPAEPKLLSKDTLILARTNTQVDGFEGSKHMHRGSRHKVCEPFLRLNWTDEGKASAEGN